LKIGAPYWRRFRRTREIFEGETNTKEVAEEILDQVSIESRD
jgi:hypothetical protein